MDRRERRRRRSLSEECLLLIKERLSKSKRESETLMTLLTELSPQAILNKGYSYVTDARGSFIKSAQAAKPGETLNIHWHDGRATVGVQKTSS